MLIAIAVGSDIKIGQAARGTRKADKTSTQLDGNTSEPGGRTKPTEKTRSLALARAQTPFLTMLLKLALGLWAGYTVSWCTRK